MNTEKMIPIDFSRNITPFVPGDVYYNNFVDAEFAMDQRDADIFNNADPRGEFNTYFIVSFADRPNTTGKQPVDDDVVVDMSKTLGGPRAASELRWARIGIIPTWKPNHEAMLAKFKEQGANTMFTFENTKEATHIYSNTQFLKIKNGKYEFINSATNFEWEDGGAAEETHFGAMELSRPVGERKEDHTIDGILTKAQPQGAKAQAVALTIEALDDNPDEQVIEPESMIGPSEFYQKGGDEQVIEPYVADHLKGLINPVSEGCQAGDVISVPYSELPPCNGEIPKPVFTQEVELLIGGGKNVPEVYKAGRFVYHGSKYSIFVTGDGKEYSRKNSKIKTRPIDNRTDEEKLKDEIYKQIVTPHIPDTYLDDVIDSLVSAGKFTITLNK